MKAERLLPAFVLVASAAVLGAVFIAQYWGRLAPCELCLKERWPWAVAIVIGFVATMTASRRALPWLALLLTVIFAASSGLAFYHVGVEHHWFAGPSACTASAGTADTLAALKAQILHQQVVRCDEPAWALWGVTLAGWNLLTSLVMTVICLVVGVRFWRSRRRVLQGGGG